MPDEYRAFETGNGITVYVHAGLAGKKKEMILTISHLLLFFTIFEETTGTSRFRK
ncbi:MAG: hypothetical protein SCK57_11120 [Bacillota bacterium]|nr:hypothetical protein [Bacillota bacterium]